MRRFATCFLLAPMILPLLGGFCDSNTTQSTEPVGSHAFEISPFSKAVPNFVDTTVNDVQVIDDEHALIYGEFESESPDCFLQIVGPDGVEPLKVNAELAKFGRVVAISNIVNNKVAVGLARANDETQRFDIRLAMVDLVNMNVTRVSETMPSWIWEDPTGDLEPALVKRWPDAFNFFKDYFFRVPKAIRIQLHEAEKIIVSTSFHAVPEIHIYDALNNKVKTVKLLLHARAGRYPYSGFAPVQIKGNRLYAAVDKVSREEFNALRLYGRVNIIDTEVFAENGALFYQIDISLGQIISVQPFRCDNDHRLAIVDIATTDNGFVAAGMLRDSTNGQKGILLNFEQRDNDELRMTWSRKVDLSEKSDKLTSISMLSDKRIVVAGSTGSIQVPGGSIVGASDAFVGIMDSRGNGLEFEKFSSSSVDRVLALRKWKETFVLLTVENEILTHDDKSTPTRFELRRIVPIV